MTYFADPLAQAKLRLPNYTFVEPIYQGTRAIVYRAAARATQQPVIIKVLSQEYPSFRELVQFRNQYTVAKNLPIEGIIHPLSLVPCGNGYGLIMEDFGGIGLAHYAQQHPLSLTEVLEIAIQLTTILHELHQHRVIHKDIKPANILIHPNSKQVKLIDFSLASLLPKETQAIQSPKGLEGSLAYLAPEQTGRMNRAIDYRTDFYALGVTLYQLLTGQLPFTSDDPLELIHCHMAQIPAAANQVNPAVPEMVAAIVVKLMAKNAEDRYQSALGLKYDLEQCLTQWKAQDVIEEFVLGQRNLSDRFVIPEKLYGRESEVQMLLDAFDRVSQGRSELMLVAGYSGVGKTAVVNEVHKPIARGARIANVRQQGYFIKGKFDQFNRNIPLSAFVQAFRDLVGQLLSESDDQLQTWKSQILEALGENAQVIVDLIPALERIVGPQPPAPELSGTAAQNRFNLLFQRFIQVFTTAQHPLVIFVDDLQWVDSASLNLIQVLMADTQTGYLLLLGAYRDNEVFSAHPLMLTLDELANVGAPIHTITLQPLKFASVNHLIADTLYAPESIVQPLTQLVMQRTQGNPFFATQFLKALHQDQLITFDRNAGYWQCDMVQVREAALTDDVVEFMALQLQKLPEATQEMLKLAACIGAQFDLETLAIVSERSQPEVATALWQALQEGLILPQSVLYKFYLGESEAKQPEPNEILHYRFLHDRVQQAAYNLIADADKSLFHLKIGRLLLQQTVEEERDRQLFVLVSQFNQGRHLLETETEQQTVLGLNIQAGEKSRKSVAYAAAIEYFEIAWTLLPDDPWGNARDLSLQLAVLRMEVAYLNGNFDQSWEIGEQTLAIVETPLERAKILEVQVLIEIARGRILEAVDLGCAILESLGVNLLDAAAAEEEIILPTPDELDAIAPMSDPFILQSMSVLMTIIPPVFIATNLFPQVVVTMLKLSLTYGHSPQSPYVYAAYGWLVTGAQGKIELGCQAGQLSLHLMEHLNTQVLRTKLGVLYHAHIISYRDPLRATLKPLRDMMYSGLDTGDLEYASYAAMHYCHYPIWAGEPLDIVEQEQERVIAFIDRYLKQAFSREFSCVWRQMVFNLRQPFTEDLFCLKGDYFNEQDRLSELQAGSVHNTLVCFYLAKSLLNYLFGRYDESVSFARQCAQHTFAIPGVYTIPIHNFVQSLAELAHYQPASEADLKTVLDLVDRNQAWLKVRVESAPGTFQHKYDLIEAERHRILGQRFEAMELYDRAIAGAKENGYIQEEALANELAAKFYLDWGKEKVAAGYMQDAYYCYYRWGAKAKTDHLEQRFPALLRPILQLSAASGDVLNMLMAVSAPAVSIHASAQKSSSRTSVNQTFDFVSILKAAQVLSSTIQLDELLRQLTQIILRNSGGDRCILVLPNDADEWQVRAIATLDQTQLYAEPLTHNPNLPLKLIQYVKNTQEIIVIDDLETDLPVFDDYIRQYQPRSILGVPILNQGRCIGILSLENRLTGEVFTNDRIAILNFLCAQAAISIENAKLYALEQNRIQQLTELNDARQRAEAEQQRQLAILESTSDFIGSADPSGKILYLNKAWRKLLQREGEESATLDMLAKQHPAWAMPIILNEALPKAKQQGMWIGETALLDGNGREFPVSQVVIAHKSSNGEVEYFSTIARDISDRKAAEAQLQQQAHRLAQANQQLEEYSQTLEQNVEARTQELSQALTTLQNTQRDLIHSEKMAALGQLTASVGHEINTPLGVIRAATSNIEAAFRASLQQLPTLFQHLSPQQQTDFLALVNTAIENQQSLSTKEERQQRRQLQDELEAQGCPQASDIASRLMLLRIQPDLQGYQSILAAPNCLEILKAAYHLVLQSQSTSNIQQEVNRAAKIVFALKTYSYQDHPEERVLARVTDGIEVVLTLYHNRLKQGVEVIRRYGAEIPQVLCTPDELTQVWVNLIDNALYAMNQQGTLEIAVTQRDHQVVVEITDSGCGIPADLQDRIFEPFFTTKPRGEGSGLGLDIVRQIVQKHEGEIQLHSRSGCTTFMICLPASIANFPPLSADQPPDL